MSLPNNQNNMMAARFYGGFFILTFLAYGVGSGVLESILGSDAALGGLRSGTLAFMTSVASMSIIHSIANIGLAVVMYVIIKPYSSYLSTGYLALAIMATVALLVGAIFLAVLVPVSEIGKLADDQLATIKTVLHRANFYIYQVGMTIWGVGGILMCVVLFRTKLVPRLFSIWGLIGYAIFIVGTVSELYSSGVGIMLSAPGGLFEISMSIWLIIKGFDYIHVERAA